MLSNEYQHDRVYMVFKNLFVLVLWTKLASALKGLNSPAAPSNFCRESRDVLFDIHNIFMKLMKIQLGSLEFRALKMTSY